MIKRFEVENFKGFSERLVLDFTKRDYDFNEDLIKNGIVNKAVVYGKNGSGKSCLGIGLFDIIHHLTDKNRMRSQYLSNYRNLRSNNTAISFLYEFFLGSDNVIYEYKKSDVDTLLHESLIINGNRVLDYDFQNRHDNYVSEVLYGDLNLELLSDSKISVVRYLYKNRPSNAVPAITRLMEFCDHMLWYRSLSEGNVYTGFSNGGQSLAKIIYDNDALTDFENFLAGFDINYNLGFKKDGDTIKLIVKYGNKSAPIENVASTGTMALYLFYAWSLSFNDISFLFIDEFDAFLHYEAAETIMKLLNSRSNFQSVLTSHNTYLMQNKITRPDCCFILNDNKLKCLTDCTEKEIREAHNLEKMYVNGAFIDE